nr:DUF4176 domain-containing protein [Streptococcus equi]
MSTVTMLPLGSIVILKGNTKKMMIIARVIAAPIKGEVYRFDYGACLYPEGMMGDSLITLIMTIFLRLFKKAMLMMTML